MIVSVFSDAAWSQDEQLGGWGACIMSGAVRTNHFGPLQGEHFEGGRIEGDNLDSNEAEAMALANGVHLAFQRRLAGKGDRLILQTDSKRVVDLLAGALKPRSSTEARAVDHIRSACRMYGASFECRHVHGHKAHLGGKYWINGACDKLARRALAQARRRREEGHAVVCSC